MRNGHQIYYTCVAAGDWYERSSARLKRASIVTSRAFMLDRSTAPDIRVDYGFRCGLTRIHHGSDRALTLGGDDRAAV